MAEEISKVDFNDIQVKLDFCIKSLESSKALDIVSIDVSENSSVTDRMIICTGTSRIHVSAIAARLEEHLYKYGFKNVTISGYNEGVWVLSDLGDVMVHVLQQEARDRYQLETLYRCMASKEDVE